MTTRTRETTTAIETRIDSEITAVALMAIQASGGRDHFDSIRQDTWPSEYGTGFMHQLVPADENDPVFLARRRIVFLLLDRELGLIGAEVGRFRQHYDQIVCEQAETRLEEMLEWQVMRPRENGGLDLHRAASGDASIVGWARKFVVGVYGARKTLKRINDRMVPRATLHDDIAGDDDMPEDPWFASRVDQAIDEHKATLRNAPDGSLRRAQAESAVIRKSYDLPDLNTSHLDEATIAVLSDLLRHDADLPLRSLSEAVLGAKTVTSHPALVQLWSEYGIHHARTLNECEHASFLVAIMVGAAVRGAAAAC